MRRRSVKAAPRRARGCQDSPFPRRLRKQREIGLDILSDREMRVLWLTDSEAVDGLVPIRSHRRSGPGGGVEVSTAREAGA